MDAQSRQWYVVLVRSNTERKVKDYLDGQQIENFLPLQTRVIEREGKRIEKEYLVLPRMIFVHINKSQMVIVRNTMNVFDFMREHSRSVPAVVRDSEMANFRYMVDYSDDQIIITNEEIPEGTRVTVAKGNLQGLKGELVRYNGKYHILVRVDLFGSALVSIPASYVKKDRKVTPLTV